MNCPSRAVDFMGSAAFDGGPLFDEESIVDEGPVFDGVPIYPTTPCRGVVLLDGLDATTGDKQQAAQLKHEFAIKERETLDVLKELGLTKKIRTGIKLKIHNETTETPEVVKSEDTDEVSVAETQNQPPKSINMDVDMEGIEENPQQPSGSVVVNLVQVKESLNRTRSDIAIVRAAVELLCNSITKGKMLLERARYKLSANTSLISSLGEELDQTTQKLETLKHLQQRRKDPADIFIEIKKMTSEVQQLMSMAKASISTAEVRCIAAKKMEEAVRAAEALALAEIKARLSSESSSEGNNGSEITGRHFV
jgi:hypothetical protein